MVNKHKKKSFLKFGIGMAIYAIVFLIAAAIGLSKFWDYIAAYEASRPENTMNAYMQQVDAEYLCRGGEGTILATVDQNIQSADQVRSYILGTLTGEIRYAKKMSESNDTQQVYMVMCDKQTVCKVTLTAQAADQYGFTPWAVTGEDFDLSYIKTSTASITVPSDYPVYLGDTRLDSSYITQDHIPYQAIAQYYKDYTPPYMVTYTSGPFLGELTFRVTDPSGQAVEISKDTDMTVFLDNCTDDIISQLEPLAQGYLKRYVDFLSCAGNNPEANYQKLREVLVPDCDLEHRFRDAVRGLTWISDRRSTISSTTFNHWVDLGNGKYLCDVTYEVDTKLHDGIAHEITTLHLIITQTDNGPKVEIMTIQ